MRILDHPAPYRLGTRVLFLKGRHKDGIEKQRTIIRISHETAEFNRQLDELAAMAEPKERIYASAEPRCIEKSVRVFKRRMLDNDYQADPQEFYRKIEARWASCLMQSNHQYEKMKRWLFDVDEPEMLQSVVTQMKNLFPDIWSDHYAYQTKNGTHVLVRPFNKSQLDDESRGLIKDNPLMLWGY
jgi:hypothetical protein